MDYPHLDAKENLIEKLKEVTGVLPPNTRQFLKLLSHPEVADHTIEWMKSLDKAGLCTTYQAPWDCEKESEAKYETIYQGFNQVLDLEFDDAWKEHWCTNCKERVMVV